MTHVKSNLAFGAFVFVFCMSLAFGQASPTEWKEKVLYSFQGIPDGAIPAGGVVFDSAGNLYGATTDGGADNCPGIAQCGTVFQLKPPAQKGGAWTETVLYVFKGKTANDGSTPAGSVILDKAGNIYGTTGYGGAASCVLLGTTVGCGTVYELTPPKENGGPWTEKILYSFKGGNDGYLPNGDLTFDSAGNLYGATEFGGGKGTSCNSLYGGQCGTVFELAAPTKDQSEWTEHVLHSFAGGTDGANPNGGLLLDAKGTVCGTTPEGGNRLCKFGNGNVGCGVVFALMPPAKGDRAWAEKIIHRFVMTDGEGPNGGLVFDATSSIYGTAGGGGKGNGLGVVFRLAHSPQTGKWSETMLYSFQGGRGGRNPHGPVTLGSAGVLFGTAGWGVDYGVFFRLKTTPHGKWVYEVLYNFRGAPDANYPNSALTPDNAGDFYGTAPTGGNGKACQGGCGAVFEVRP
jgi:hypothetical protein